MNLFEYILARGKPLNLHELQILIMDLLLSLQLLHSKGIFHLDLQPNNILVLNPLDSDIDNEAGESENGSHDGMKSAGGLPLNMHSVISKN